MNEQTAQAIINEALNQDVIDANPPAHLKTKVADYLVEQATEAFSKGEKGQHVQAILTLSKMDDPPDPNGTPELKFDDSDEDKYQIILHEKIEDNLPIPPEIDIQVPSIPVDITDLNFKELRYLFGAYNACSARANWLYAYEQAGESAAKEIADHHEDEYTVTADRKDYGGKAKSAKLLSAEAEKANPDILKWRKREEDHSRRANKYKRLLDTYDNSCDRLSREMTYRMKEMDHS